MNSLSRETLQEVCSRLQQANAEQARHYPGESPRRQPVHTVYGGAHLFRADTAARMGEAGQRAMKEYAPNFLTFAKAVGLPGAEGLPESPDPQWEKNLEGLRKGNRGAWLARTIHARVVEKLQREPLEDFRIDFEDGYGNRPDGEEDGHARAAAEEAAAGLAAGTLPPFLGIRIKPLSEELRERSLRTLDLFLSTLTAKAGRLPGHFVVTLPKITSAEQVAALADVFDLLEPKLGLAPGELKLELMIETTQAILNLRGEVNLPHLHAAARGRCVAAHFGTYDYTAACSITAAHQHMTHPACDFARRMMQVAFAGTGLWLSDGATNILPVGPHRGGDGSAPLTSLQRGENRAAVHRAWRLHFDHIQHSLANGFYQGWDLHPAQLPTRYAAVYAFFLEGLEAASERLRNFVAKAAQATLVGDVFDDAATGQGLLNFFLRALNCGAITEEEALPLTGLMLEELRMGSFVRILKSRTG